MAITQDEQARLQIELAEALNCKHDPAAAERLRLLIWHALDQRRALINPPTDRRSREAAALVAKMRA